jgi:hypothetical protein
MQILVPADKIHKGRSKNINLLIFMCVNVKTGKVVSVPKRHALKTYGGGGEWIYSSTNF